MRRNTIINSATAFAMVVGLAVPPALADDDGWFRGWGMGRMMERGWGQGHGPMMGFGQDVILDRIDGRLAFLKTELKITDAQLGTWEALSAAIRDNAEVHNSMMRERMEEMRSGAFLDKPLPDRLAIQETQMEAHLLQMKEIRAALEKLYAELDDTQKKTADEIFPTMIGMGMGMGMGTGIMGRGMGGMMRDE